MNGARAAGPARIAVMGSGSWGTAFALVLSDAENQVTLWARRPELAAMINNQHRNVDYFPTIALPDPLHAASDPDEVMDGADFVVLAVPSQSLRANLAHWQIPGQAIVVSLAKGIELGTGSADEPGHRGGRPIEAERIAVVTGPNLAREIAEASRRPAWWPVSPRPPRRRCRPCATPHASGPTPTPTWWAASSPAQPRT